MQFVNRVAEFILIYHAIVSKILFISSAQTVILVTTQEKPCLNVRSNDLTSNEKHSQTTEVFGVFEKGDCSLTSWFHDYISQYVL